MVQAKLAAVIPDGTDSTWIHERLLPLVGVESGQTSREESFAAWRAFLEGLTAKGPAVVVVEDLHWADDALLAFLEDAARESTRGPLFLLATARPEFLGTQPDFAANLPNAHRLELAPLSTEDTAALVASLLGSVVPPELTGPIVERADGNPLYAEEYVALLRDRDLLVEADGVAKLRPGVELPVPTSIHGLLAARLDTLPVERKALMSDAAVVGKVFWDGALVAMDRTGPPRCGCRPGRPGRAELRPTERRRAAWLARRSTRSGTCWGATSHTGSCRAARARNVTRQQPHGWRRSWASASTISPTSSPTIGGTPWSSRVRPARRSVRRPMSPRRSTSWFEPVTARAGWIRQPPRPDTRPRWR